MLRGLFCFKTENSRPAKNNTLRRSTYDLRKSAALLFMYLHLIADLKVSVIRVSFGQRNFLILWLSTIGCFFLFFVGFLLFNLLLALLWLLTWRLSFVGVFCSRGFRGWLCCLSGRVWVHQFRWLLLSLHFSSRSQIRLQDVSNALLLRGRLWALKSHFTTNYLCSFCLLLILTNLINYKQRERARF